MTALLARLDAQMLGTYRTERRVRRTLAGAAARRGTIIAGPWTGECGHEALYWIPFLRWAVDRYGVNPQRVVAVSRASMAPCYAGIAGRLVQREEMSGLDMRNACTWSPNLMFDLFSAFWKGRRSLDFLFRHTDFRYGDRPSAAGPGLGLPADYVAVELYTGGGIADTAANRTLLHGIVERIAARTPIVTIDAASGNAVQVIAGARQFVGTCGGFALLAPFLGVNTVTLYDDDHDADLSTHLYAARYAYRKSRAAHFSALNIKALRNADFALDTTA